MASMGFEAVLTIAIIAEMIPKKIPPHTVAIVAMYSSYIRKVRSWKSSYRMAHAHVNARCND